MGAGLAVLAPGPSASGRRLLGWRWRIGCRSSLAVEMADVLVRPFTRLHRLAVSPPLRSPLCGLRHWCRWWLQMTLEPGVAVISSFLRVLSVQGWGCTVLSCFNITPSFRKKKIVYDFIGIWEKETTHSEFGWVRYGFLIGGF